MKECYYGVGDLLLVLLLVVRCEFLYGSEVLVYLLIFFWILFRKWLLIFFEEEVLFWVFKVFFLLMFLFVIFVFGFLIIFKKKWFLFCRECFLIFLEVLDFFLNFGFFWVKGNLGLYGFFFILLFLDFELWLVVFIVLLYNLK